MSDERPAAGDAQGSSPTHAPDPPRPAGPDQPRRQRDIWSEARRARTAEWQVAGAFWLSVACAIGVFATYVAGGQVQVEGVLLAGMLGGIGAGLVLWAKHFLPSKDVIEERKPLISTPEQKEAFEEIFAEGERAIGRRRLLVGSAIAAFGTLIVALLPPVRSLGPRPKGLKATPYRRKLRLVSESGSPIKPTDLDRGGVITAFPEGATDDSQAATLLIRPGRHVKARTGRQHWTPDGLVAYSKLCTHVGCPVGLYQARSHLLLCPCHQSTFDVLDAAKPIFGPAARALPQLPLEIGDDGYVRSAGDFSSPPGPGFWDRAR